MNQVITTEEKWLEERTDAITQFTTPEEKSRKQKVQRAFKRAIENGRLSENSDAENYVGDYMYMDDGCFKHSETRQYLAKLIKEDN